MIWQAGNRMKTLQQTLQHYGDNIIFIQWINNNNI